MHGCDRGSGEIELISGAAHHAVASDIGAGDNSRTTWRCAGHACCVMTPHVVTARAGTGRFRMLKHQARLARRVQAACAGGLCRLLYGGRASHQSTNTARGDRTGGNWSIPYDSTPQRGRLHAKCRGLRFCNVLSDATPQGTGVTLDQSHIRDKTCI